MILERLFETIVSRKTADPTTSYTAKLFSRGRARIAQKVGEEAVETVIAASTNDTAHIVTESADLLYHLLQKQSYQSLFEQYLRHLFANIFWL